MSHMFDRENVKILDNESNCHKCRISEKLYINIYYKTLNRQKDTLALFHIFKPTITITLKRLWSQCRYPWFFCLNFKSDSGLVHRTAPIYRLTSDRARGKTHKGKTNFLRYPQSLPYGFKILCACCRRILLKCNVIIQAGLHQLARAVSITTPSQETCGVKVKLNTKPLRIITCYSPPHSNNLSEILPLRRDETPCVLAANFNAKHDALGCRSKNSKVTSLLKLLLRND